MLQLDLSWNTVHQFFTTHCLCILVLKLRVQKRALSIMNPSHTYEANLAQFGLTTLYKRRQELCNNQFETISTTLHKLSYLLPPNHCPNRHLRKCHEYDLPHIHTDRFKDSFIPATCAKKFLKT